MVGVPLIVNDAAVYSWPPATTVMPFAALNVPSAFRVPDTITAVCEAVPELRPALSVALALASEYGLPR